MAHTMFKETQKYRRWDVIVAIVLALALLAYGCINQLFLSTSSDALGVGLMVASAFVLLGLLVYFASIRFTTVVNDKNIRYQFYPLHYKKQKIKIQDIERCELVNTPVSAEYSGWGVNLDNDERMYSVLGRNGLALTLKDGKHIFLGTQKPEQFNDTIQRLITKA